MEDSYFMACKTCSEGKWIEITQIEAYINKHTGHQFHLLSAEDYENPDHFAAWFMNFMGWTKEAEE